MIVIDASVTLAWILPDEHEAPALRVLDRVLAEGAGVPALWRWEVQNALRTAERRKRITPADLAEAIVKLRALNVEIQSPAPLGRDLELSRKFDLTVYDAAYLELAIRMGWELATVDERFALVAERLGVLLSTARNCISEPYLETLKAND
jgi:predicted nucleic acid-binding protein